MTITDEMTEIAARKICEEWGYDWVANPDKDDQGIPDQTEGYDERPSRALFLTAARSVLEAIAPAIRKAAMEEAAKYHDAKIARLEETIKNNNAYTQRTGSKDNEANNFCLGLIGNHRLSAAAIRTLAGKEGTP
jgi:hypothetical protein